MPSVRNPCLAQTVFRMLVIGHGVRETRTNGRHADRALQRFLHDQRQPVEPLAHVGVARRQPHPNARRHRDHRPDNALATRANAAASTSAPTTIRASPRMISTRPAMPGFSGAIATGTNPTDPGGIVTFSSFTCQPRDALAVHRQGNQWFEDLYGGAEPLQNPLFLANVTM